METGLHVKSLSFSTMELVYLLISEDPSFYTTKTLLKTLPICLPIVFICQTYFYALFILYSAHHRSSHPSNGNYKKTSPINFCFVSFCLDSFSVETTNPQNVNSIFLHIERELNFPSHRFNALVELLGPDRVS